MTRWLLPLASLVAGALLIGVSVPQLAGAGAAAGEVPAVAPVPAVATGHPPTRLRLPTLGVDAPVSAVRVEPGGALGVPDDPAVVGWWADGAAPGSAAGSVVLDGHVDSRVGGPGALLRLAGLRPGDPVGVLTGGGVIGYEVAAVRHYAKAELPAEVFDRAGGPRLVLISCGGAFDRSRRSYAENVVVFAVPARPG